MIQTTMAERLRLWKPSQVRQIVYYVATSGGCNTPSVENWMGTLNHLTENQAKVIFRNLPQESRGNRTNWDQGLTDREVLDVIEGLCRISAGDDSVSEKLRQIGLSGQCRDSLRVCLSDTSFPSQLREFSARISH